MIILLPSLMMVAAIIAVVWFVRTLGEGGYRPKVTKEKTLFRRSEFDE